MLPMEKARYRARAKAWQLGAAGTGMPQAGVEFEVEDGDHKAERISGYFALSDAAAEYTLQKLRTCGWTGTDIFELEDPVKSASMGANVVELVVAPEDHVKDGQPVIDETTGEVKRTLRIQFVNRVGGLAMKGSINDEQKKILGAKLKAKLAALDAKAKKAGNGAAPPPHEGPSGPNPPPPTDDIPF